MSTTATPPKQPPVFNLPNQLTAARLGLGIILFVLIEHEQWLWCIGIFALAAFTDWLDGYVARLQGITSTLGRNLDPLVDKVVICGAYVFLLQQRDPSSGLTPWMVVIVVSRELIITGLRSFLENLGANFGAEWLGKIKMVLQCGALFAIFLALYENNSVTAWVRDILVWAMLVATALSGLQYFWKAFVLLRKDR
ncbi:MAG: CDP-diacylglycerol--glycerol-3-phosphate 3-phosphatidyltransferase [Planctomycetes bacterium]|nr:CDP-diacylglycerol--glycerol-3-phosphate 3-phosphatidyltransferase [Planctomycetota bacterium]